MKRTLATAGLSALLSVSVLTACSPGSNATADNEFGDNAAGAVSIVGFAVPKAAHDAVQAACGIVPPLPKRMQDLYERPERLTGVANDLGAIEALIEEKISA